MSGFDSANRTEPIRPGDEIFIEAARSRRDIIHRRLLHGFECHGEFIGDRWRAPFVEKGLRSDQHHVLRRLVHLTPRAGRLQSGRGKDVVKTSDSKLLALDDPWLVLNSEVRGVFRIDLDITFSSWAALRYEIEQLRLPCLPNAVVGFEADDRRIERPHVLHLLPADALVWFAPDDPRCRTDVMALWRGVHAGITKTYLPLGADPGALSNPTRIKNPMSPFWSFQTWNETCFPTMSEWAEWVDTGTNRHAMIRESALALAGARKASNVMFTTFQQWSYTALRELHDSRDDLYVGAIKDNDRDSLAELLFRKLVGAAGKAAQNPKQAQAVLYRVVDYAAHRWDPERASRTRARDRGACAHQTDGVRRLAERQAIGGRYAAAAKATRAIEAIRSAIQSAIEAGEVITKAGIAHRAGLSRPTVIRHWPAMVDLLAEADGKRVSKSVYSKKAGPGPARRSTAIIWGIDAGMSVRNVLPTVAWRGSPEPNPGSSLIVGIAMPRQISAGACSSTSYSTDSVRSAFSAFARTRNAGGRNPFVGTGGAIDSCARSLPMFAFAAPTFRDGTVITTGRRLSSTAVASDVSVSAAGSSR